MMMYFHLFSKKNIIICYDDLFLIVFFLTRLKSSTQKVAILHMPVRNFPCQTLKISKVSLVVMGS
jgi:hypothetical protein